MAWRQDPARRGTPSGGPGIVLTCSSLTSLSPLCIGASQATTTQPLTCFVSARPVITGCGMPHYIAARDRKKLTGWFIQPETPVLMVGSQARSLPQRRSLVSEVLSQWTLHIKHAKEKSRWCDYVNAFLPIPKGTPSAGHHASTQHLQDAPPGTTRRGTPPAGGGSTLGLKGPGAALETGWRCA